MAGSGGRRLATFPAGALTAFARTWRVVLKESASLEKTRQRLLPSPVDAEWALSIEKDDALAERIEAFVSRYGRLQDTLGDKLFPRLLELIGQRGKTLLDVLNQVKRIGLLREAQSWLEWRNPRNQLVHEYMESPREFAIALNTANEYAGHLVALLAATRQWLAAQVWAMRRWVTLRPHRPFSAQAGTSLSSRTVCCPMRGGNRMSRARRLVCNAGTIRIAPSQFAYLLQPRVENHGGRQDPAPRPVSHNRAPIRPCRRQCFVRSRLVHPAPGSRRQTGKSAPAVRRCTHGRFQPASSRRHRFDVRMAANDVIMRP